MKKNFTPFLTVALLFFAACSNKSTPVAAVPKISYTANVLPLIQSKCAPCHLPSKGGFKQNFENYDNAQKYASAMVTRVELDSTARGYMPFKKAKLGPEEINIFRNWVRDGLLEK